MISLGEHLRNGTASWASHFSRRSVMFSFENLQLHQLFLEVRTVYFLQYLSIFSGNIWKTNKSELALNSLKMLTLEKRWNKASCVFDSIYIKGHVSTHYFPYSHKLCSPTSINTGYPDISLAYANVGAGTVCFYECVCKPLVCQTFGLYRQNIFEWAPHSNGHGTSLTCSTCISIYTLHRIAPELVFS